MRWNDSEMVCPVIQIDLMETRLEKRHYLRTKVFNFRGVKVTCLKCGKIHRHISPFLSRCKCHVLGRINYA